MLKNYLPKLFIYVRLSQQRDSNPLSAPPFVSISCGTRGSRPAAHTFSLFHNPSGRHKRGCNSGRASNGWAGRFGRRRNTTPVRQRDLKTICTAYSLRFREKKLWSQHFRFAQHNSLPVVADDAFFSSFDENRRHLLARHRHHFADEFVGQLPICHYSSACS